MVWLREKIIILIALLFVYTAFFITHQGYFADQQVLGASASLTLFTQPEDGRPPILDAINSAQKEIDIEIYMFSDREIINSIEAAENRGVHVNVLLEKHPFGAGSINQKTYADLQQHGVAVAWTHDVFPLTHEKMILIDAKKVFILNQNLTAASFEKNREFNILDADSQDVMKIKNQFAADWNNTSFSFDDKHILLSPINSRAILTKVISQATQSLSIEMEVIDDPSVIQLLAQKAKNIHVSILLPTLSKIPANKKAVKLLKNAGAKIRFVDHMYLHAKLIMSDAEKAYIGSVNLTTQSMDENRELGIILSQQDVLGTIQQIFTKDWESAVIF